MGCVKSNLNPSDLLTVLSWLTQFEIINIKHVEPVVRRKGRPCHLKTQALMSCEGLMTNDSWTEVLSSLFVLIWSRVSLWEIPRAAWSDLWYVSMVESTYCVSWLNGVPVLFVKSVILYDCVLFNHFGVDLSACLAHHLVESPKNAWTSWPRKPCFAQKHHGKQN